MTAKMGNGVIYLLSVKAHYIGNWAGQGRKSSPIADAVAYWQGAAHYFTYCSKKCKTFKNQQPLKSIKAHDNDKLAMHGKGSAELPFFQNISEYMKGVANYFAVLP